MASMEPHTDPMDIDDPPPNNDDDEDDEDTTSESSTDDDDDDDNNNNSTSMNNSQTNDADDDDTTSEEDVEMDEDAPQQQQPLVQPIITLRPSPTHKSPSLATSTVPGSNSIGSPSKMRIKLTMRKLPVLANRKLPIAGGGVRVRVAAAENTDDSDENNDDDEIKATVVDSDEAGDDEAVATAGGGGGGPSASSHNKPSRRRNSAQVTRAKIPPLSSPGLLMTPPTNSQLPKLQHGLVAPASVFDHAMEIAGYTVQARSQRPHRGSSVQRTVHDMFDSDVTLTLRFPHLLPSVVEDGSLTKLLIDSLEPKQQPSATASASSHHPRKRPLRFVDMAPVTLTIPYPEEYIQRRVKYIQKVNAREKAIVVYQDALEESDIDVDTATPEDMARLPAVPPIPERPIPPSVQELKDHHFPLHKYEDTHPIFPPKGKESFVAHLDRNCFHLTEGRYFGLLSNTIADPNFVGPNAPGLSGLHASGGSGLATSTSGGGISGAMALTMTTTYNATTARAHSALRSSSSSTNPPLVANTAKSNDSPKKETAPAEDDVPSTRHVGPQPTASASDLKKIVEEDGPLSQGMKDCIIKAAVHASRSGRHGQSFLAPNGEIYPDVSKAFAAHAGIKPCERCKNNKQGSYHCRLRRRHVNADYDGGDSWGLLSPLFTAPMESLLCKQQKSG